MKQWNLYTAKEIKPNGWLKRQLAIQAKGLSGHLDKIWPDIRDSAWIGGQREGWERVPYWLDGFIPLAYLLEDEDMIARAKKYIDAILSAQCDDGWICPCPEEKRAKYDNWAVQLISKVLVNYYECSGDTRAKTAVYRALKNYYELLKDGTICLFGWGECRWFETFIAINFLYEDCGEEWLKDLAKILYEQGTDYNTVTHLWERPLNKWIMQTHIVNLTMMLKAEAVSADILGREYQDEAEKLRTILDTYNGTVYGSFTGDECLSGRSAIQGTELCAIVEQMYSYELLYAYTGEQKWAQRLELVAFNALPAAISEDMWTHQYVQMSNQISTEKFPGRSLFRTNNSEAHLFGLEPHYGCCTSNFSQGWPKLCLSAFMHRDHQVRHAVLLPATLRADGLEIVAETDYPFKNSVKYTISSDHDFVFSVGVPSFAENIVIDGKAVKEVPTFDIKAGKTEISISFESSPYFEKRWYDLQAVRCGSLVFSVPIAFEKRMKEYEKDGVERKFPYCDYEYLPKSQWRYGYCNAPLTVERGAVGDIPFSVERPAVTVRASVREIDWDYEDGFETVCAKVPHSVEGISEVKEINLHPYGCAKLRMTELPFVK